MTMSLAASPVLPIATAGVAAALILGTLSSSPTAGALGGEDALGGAPAATDTTYDPAAEAPATGAKVVKACTATACTLTFPTGGTVKALGTTITATKLYVDGIGFTLGGEPLVANATTPATSQGYTLKVVKVEGADAASRTVTVKLTKK